MIKNKIEYLNIVILFLILLSFVGVVSAENETIAGFTYDLREGDILFGNSGTSFIWGPITHTAIYNGSESIVEWRGKTNTTKISNSSFADRNYFIGVGQVTSANNAQATKAIEYARDQIGDILPMPCSNLIYYAYDKEEFNLDPIGDNDYSLQDEFYFGWEDWGMHLLPLATPPELYRSSEVTILTPTIFRKDEVKGFVFDKENWTANVSISNMIGKKLIIKLSWDNTGNILDLIIKDPNGQIYTNDSVEGGFYFFSNSLFVDMEFDNPIDGEWEVIVNGNNVNSGDPFYDTGYEYFKLESDVDNLETVTPDQFGGINFTSVNLNYISTCDTGEIKFVMKGEEAQGAEPIINISNATSDSLDYFLAALAIPDHNLWITMDTKPGPGFAGLVGDVSRVDETLTHTKLGQTLFDADIQLKSDHFGQSQALVEGLINDWIANVSGTILPGFYARVWISSDSIEANGSGCEIFIVDSSLKVQSVVESVSLGVGGYDSELADFESDLESGLADIATQAEIKVNNDSAYEELRRAYASIALAQWYKQQPLQNASFNGLIDSKDISGLDIGFDQAYYETQAWQHLYTFYPSPGWWYSIYGGVVLTSSNPQPVGEIPNNTVSILENASLESYVQENETLFFSVGKNPEKPDITPLALGFSKLTPDKDENVNITLVVINEGKINATNFNVQFSYEYAYPNGYTAEYLIGEQEVNNLNVDEIKLVSVLTNSSLIGYHNIIAKIDYHNSVEEFNELNNEINKIIEIVDPNPTAEIILPVSGTQYQINETIDLEGIGIDRKDGELNESTYNWTSNVGGYLGNGSVLLVNLSLGDHIISLNVVDSDVNTATSQVLISISPSQPPTITLNAPYDGQVFEEGETVYFDGEAVDNEDGQLNDTSLIWNSSIDGLLGSGESFGLSSLSVGAHNITFSAEDSSEIIIEETILITIEESTPNVTIFVPENNSEFFYFQDNISFNGSSNDPHEGDISSQLNWISSLDGEIGSGSVFSKILSSGNHIISAFVTDTFGLSNIAKIYLTIFESLPPTISVISPTNNQQITNGETIIFKSNVNDPETGSLSGDNLTWNSNIDGGIGNGTEFNHTNLTIGIHEITLSAIDQDNKSSSISINITINSASPNVTILSPSSGEIFGEGEDILFNGSSTDYEDGELTGGSLVWYSAESQIGTGNSFNLSNLTVGTHVITLNATDSHSTVSTETRTIVVTGLGENTLGVFSDGSSNKELTYNSTGQQIVYARIPKGANITSATLQLEGLVYE